MLLVNKRNILLIFDNNKNISSIKDIIWYKYGFNTPLIINNKEFLFYKRKKIIEKYNIIIIFINKQHVITNLKILKFIFSKYEKIKIIILSSTSIFDKLIKLDNNIKKYHHINNCPVDYNKLDEILLKLKIELDDYKKIQNISFLKNFHKNFLTINNVFRTRKYFRILTIKFYNLDNNYFINILKAINDFVNQTNEIYFLFTKNNKIILLFISDINFFLKTKCLEICNKISLLIFQNFKVCIGIGISKCMINKVINTYNITDGFMECKNALDLCFNFGYNTIIFFEDIKNNKKIHDFFIEIYYDISNSFSLNNKYLIIKNVKNFIYQLNKTLSSKEECIFQCKVMIVLLIKKVYEMTNNTIDICNIQRFFLKKIENSFFLKDIYDILLKMIDNLLKILLSSKKNIISLQIFKAKDYIKKNYHNNNLSLNNVTEHIEISTSYFSNIFKTKTGMTFVEYLTKIRIEKAKQLFLLTDKLIYEIAYEVGFSDAHYFSSIFKKNVGVTPREYKINFGKNS